MEARVCTSKLQYNSVIQLNANPTDDTYYHPRQYIGVNDTLHTILGAGFQYTWAGLSNVYGYENQGTALLSQITSDYNTGWMNGDIKLATLSDTDDTNVTGSNLVSGDAATDDTNASTGWSAYSGATPSVNSNALRLLWDVLYMFLVQVRVLVLATIKKTLA